RSAAAARRRSPASAPARLARSHWRRTPPRATRAVRATRDTRRRRAARPRFHRARRAGARRDREGAPHSWLRGNVPRTRRFGQQGTQFVVECAQVAAVGRQRARAIGAPLALEGADEARGEAHVVRQRRDEMLLLPFRLGRNPEPEIRLPETEAVQ